MNETLNTKIGQYVKLRDYKEQAKKEFDESMKRVNDAMKKLEGEFLNALNEGELNSINTPMGTAYKIHRSSCTVKDRDDFFRFAVQTRRLDALDIRANKKIVREILGEGVEVPGVKFTESIQIGIRRGEENE
jgi:hypothetical protein